MKDADDWISYRASLIRSARLDLEPAPPAVRRRILSTLAAVGASSGVAAAGAATSVATSGGASLIIAKWFVGGALLGTLTTGAVELTRSLRESSSLPENGPASAVGSSVPRPGPDRVSARAPARDVDRLDDAQRPRERSAVRASAAEEGRVLDTEMGAPANAARVLLPPAHAGASSLTSPAALAPELALLDRARSAVASGDPRSALATLDLYRREFPAGKLAPEATALRIQALSNSGESKAARALAERFLSENPGSPHARRVRALKEKLSRE